MDSTRRSFIKRSSFGVTSLAILGVGTALADGSSSAQRKTVEKVQEAQCIRKTTQPQREAQSLNQANMKIWVDQGDPIISIENPDLPTPPIPDAPAGYPVQVGWKENINEVSEKLKDELPGSNGGISYDPDEDGESSGTESGIGAPPAGYEWTTQVRDRILAEQVHYAMTFIFADN